MVREAGALITEIDELYDRALRASEEAGIPYNVACVVYQKGLLRRLVGDNGAAAALFRQAMSSFEAVLADHASARNSISMCHFYLGQALLRMGDYAGARKHLNTAISLDHAIGETSRLRAAGSMISECGEEGKE
jgi:tetratricopeptide (TPR) repeat protein